MSDCFISYGRRDDEVFVEKLRDALCARGVDVWWDRVGMASRGKPFLRVIDDAIRAAVRVVFVVGPEALASDYVQHELSVAGDGCQTVVRILRKSDVSALDRV